MVNEEMKPFASEAEKVLEKYTASNGSDHQQLAKELQNFNSGLIKSCTMAGKSHEELHKWLHPHLELVFALEKETEATKAKQVVAQLQNSYQQYHQFFQ